MTKQKAEITFANHDSSDEDDSGVFIGVAVVNANHRVLRPRPLSVHFIKGIRSVAVQLGLQNPNLINRPRKSLL